VDHLPTETPEQMGRRVLKQAGYAHGGAVHEDEAEDKALIKKELGKARIKVRSGGKVDGKKPEHRPDRRARGGRADGGDVNEDDIPVPQRKDPWSNFGGPLQPKETVGGHVMDTTQRIKKPVPAGGYARGGNLNGMVHVDRRYEAEGINQPHGPEKRADGGATKVLDGGGAYRSGRPEMPPQDYQRVPERADGGGLGMMKHGGKGRGAPKNITIVVGRGGEDGGAAQAQMAHQAGVQQGAALARMGPGAGGPPRPPMAPPMAGPSPGAMPPPGGGGMAGGPPMMGAPRPPPMMPPGGMPMHAKGGVIKVREHKRRAPGGAL
jgi:hypothetical protein